ncbi:hypothetical protein B0H13DRAFT_2232477 [Mycena leptocephala]|nr:hypothetical protein B0H13DRAFT_2232477 [Mycena leptocephala]
MADNRRAPYSGLTRKLIVSIDVGTTFTATSFCLLQPGNVPKFEEILRWPKQVSPGHSRRQSPSVLYYDKQGNPKAFGAETEDEDTIIEAEENGWVKVEWWKLLLRPAHLPIIRDLALPPLPNNVTVDKIFADHLRYIKDQVKAYITSTYGSGDNIWDILSQTMYVILTTPNGWEGSQQGRMRQAAINAGLVDQAGGRRVRFVTEAEAAVLYAADSGSVGDWLVADGHLILCDCGASPFAHCFPERLRGTEWDDEERLQRIVYNFDRNAKKKFAEGDAVCYVQLDGHKTIPNLGIMRGRLKITGDEMQSFFAAPLKQIQEGLEIAFENGGQLADKVILVGGLASSPYMFSKLVAWGKEFGISVSRPDGPTTKAVANGALAWHLDSSVGARIAKCHYGIPIRVPFKESNSEHCEKGRRKALGIEGEWYVHDAWSGIVKKNDKIKASKEFSKQFHQEMKADAMNFVHESTIYAYRRLMPPTFIKFPGKQTLVPGFDVVCTVKGDLQNCYHAASYSITPSGFQVCLGLGETELTARLCWKENGVPVYGPATIAYD